MWIRPWPWFMVSLALSLIIAYTRSVLVFYQPSPEGRECRGREEGARPEMAAEEREILDLAREERYEEALCWVEHCLERGDLDEMERAAIPEMKSSHPRVRGVGKRSARLPPI